MQWAFYKNNKHLSCQMYFRELLAHLKRGEFYYYKWHAKRLLVLNDYITFTNQEYEIIINHI